MHGRDEQYLIDIWEHHFRDHIKITGNMAYKGFKEIIRNFFRIENYELVRGLQEYLADEDGNITMGEFVNLLFRFNNTGKPLSSRSLMFIILSIDTIVNTKGFIATYKAPLHIPICSYLILKTHREDSVAILDFLDRDYIRHHFHFGIDENFNFFILEVDSNILEPCWDLSLLIKKFFSLIWNNNVIIKDSQKEIHACPMVDPATRHIYYLKK